MEKKLNSAGFQTIDYYKDKDNAIKGILLTLNENKLMAYINLHDPSIRDASAKEIANIYRDYIGEIPDSESFSIGTQIGRDQSAADLEFNITSPDSDTLTFCFRRIYGKIAFI